MDSLHDQVYPVTRRSNASECDVTFEWYCTATKCSHKDHTFEFCMNFCIYKYNEFIFHEFYMKKQPKIE